MAQQLANLAGILQNIQIPPGVYPTMIDLPAPPKLEGALGPNDLLAQARRHAYNRVMGPDSMVIYKGFVYTGQANGWLVEISPFGAIRRLARFPSRTCGRFGRRGGMCGRPMGIRLDSRGFLIVADAYHGIFKVNPRSGRFRQLVHPRLHRPNNRPVGFINDLTISKDGLIFFTSSSTKWPLAREDNIILEGENSGRVLYYNPRELRWSKQVQEVLTNLSFPTGIQLSKDDSYLLVGEGTRSRIHRIWLGPKPPKPQRLEVFADNLPGVVDKIRLSPRGTYWVGFSQSRHRGLPSVLDLFGRKPRIRGALITLMNSRVAFTKPRFGMVVELNEEGQVIRTLQDPRGKVYTSVSEVQEDDNGILFLASPRTTFIGYMKLSPSSAATSPSPDQSGSGTGSGSPGTGSPGSGTPGSGTGLGTPGSGSGLGPPLGLGLSFPLSQNPKVVAFLMKVRNNVMRMTARRIRQVVIELIKQLILAKRQSIILRRLADAREEDLQRIKEALLQLQQNRPGTGDSGSMTTTMALPTTTDFSTSAGEQETTTISGSQETTTVMSPGGTDETTTIRTDTTTTASSPDFTTTTTASSETSMGSDGTTSTTVSPQGNTTPGSTETASTTDAPDTTTTSTIQDTTTTAAAADSETTTTAAAETTTTVAETETTTTEGPTTTTTTKTTDD